MNIKKVPLSELKSRMDRLKAKMTQTQPDWEIGVVFSKINQYYFTGTMQDGMLLIPREGDPVYRVRRSFDRATDESNFPDIRPMESYRDAMGDYTRPIDTLYIEADSVPLSVIQRFKKYFPYKNLKPMDAQILSVRSVKSDYEVDLMKTCGQIHRHVLEDLAPGLMEEGMSEVDLALKLYEALVQNGHHGTVRFGGYDVSLVMGHVCFGESSIYPTYFDGPGGNYGLNPAVPFLGNKDRKLKKGDLVFVDVACGYEGYHTDKTMTYVFGGSLPDDAVRGHHLCRQVQDRIAAGLKPGNTPAELYNETMASLDPEFLKNFMGFGQRSVKFLGHGIGLWVDEPPVIADKFNEPLQENMVIALEPKKGFAGVGMVGVENTFLVTKDGGQILTGTNPGLIRV
ncbi:MAG TPA: peptidase M24 [Clostridiales bacterium]|nr:peptidase M24 [Clostridiales bacterium]